MQLDHFASHRLGDIRADYHLDTENGQMELRLVPWALRGRTVPRRETLPGESVEARGLPERMREKVLQPRKRVDPLVPLFVRGDRGPGGWSGGATLRGSPGQQLLQFSDQQCERSRNGASVCTMMERKAMGLRVEHRLDWRRGEAGLRVRVTVENRGSEDLTLDLLSSFCLGGITPFAPDEATGRLIFHRYRSGWSNEGRPVSEPLEALSMERSWSGAGVRCERLGNVGSLPVRGWFPHAAVEDREAGVCWGAQLCHNGSWQLELRRRDDTVSLSGGLADRLFGHWWKTLAPGDRFSAPEARLTVVAGDASDAARRLVAMQAAALRDSPKEERDLPIVFNEWCTSWGNPTEEVLTRLADRLQGTDVRYLVIDAGWSARPVSGWQAGNGDWLVDRGKFPRGLRAAAEAIRARGMIPGLWFEFEVVTEGAKIFDRTGHQLQLDGSPVDMGGRRFWDFRDPWVRRYLREKVIERLKEGRFGYLKVDYNDSIGLGCDGAESPGEGLREHLDAVRGFFREIREALPDLVVENCASGGHRLEPSMQEVCAMGSFSDAHECVEIPIIAAQLHWQVLPRQLQVWGVLRETDDRRRLQYSLAACFLGRMVLSGDVHSLSPSQWAVAQEAMAFYRKAVPVIREGGSRIIRAMGVSHRHPEGWQAVVRTGIKGRELLVVVHRFGGRSPHPIALPLTGGGWRVADEFGETRRALSIESNQLRVPGMAPFSARAVLLRADARKHP